MTQYRSEIHIYPYGYECRDACDSYTYKSDWVDSMHECEHVCLRKIKSKKFYNEMIDLGCHYSKISVFITTDERCDIEQLFEMIEIKYNIVKFIDNITEIDAINENTSFVEFYKHKSFDHYDFDED